MHILAKTEGLQKASPIGSEKVYTGREVLSTSFNEKDLENINNVISMIENIYPKHCSNVKEIDYLFDVYKGKQDILNKFKDVRPEINNKIVENNIFYIVEFKKSYEFSEPIQFVQKSQDNKEKIDKLNEMFEELDKADLDKDLGESMIICGTGYRFIGIQDNDLFMQNVDTNKAAVIYSRDIDKRPIAAFYEKKLEDNKKELLVYTKTKCFYLRSEDSKNFEISQVKPNGYLAIPIIEYPLNKHRLGYVEVALPSANLLNQILSGELDDYDQFIQALMVIINADLDTEQISVMRENGLIKLKSPAGKTGQSADIKMLTNKLSFSDVGTLKSYIYNNMLAIVGVPQVAKGGSSGDTGAANEVSEGWRLAEERAKQDESSFRKAERSMLKVLFSLSQTLDIKELKDLSVNDFEIKFTRNRTDNLLVKSQSFLNFKQANLTLEQAFEFSNLTTDPLEEARKVREYYGDDVWSKQITVPNPVEPKEVDGDDAEDNEGSKDEEKKD